jgi:hypothetical protein
VKPFDVDEKIKLLGAIDKVLPKLYLSDKSLKVFDAYESIIIHAALMIKLLALPVSDKEGLVNVGALAAVVVEIVPDAKEGFDKWGDGYAYHWVKYFHDEILRNLRHEVSGVDDLKRDTESIERLAVDSRRAQINVRASLEQTGLPDNLIEPDESAAASSSVAEKT